MVKYIPKPIEAIQFMDDPDTIISIQKFMGDGDVRIDYSNNDHPKLKVRTFNGDEEANIGDYVMADPQFGEYFKVIDKKSFEQFYELKEK